MLLQPNIRTTIERISTFFYRIPLAARVLHVIFLSEEECLSFITLVLHTSIWFNDSIIGKFCYRIRRRSLLHTNVRKCGEALQKWWLSGRAECDYFGVQSLQFSFMMECGTLWAKEGAFLARIQSHHHLCKHFSHIISSCCAGFRQPGLDWGSINSLVVPLSLSPHPFEWLLEYQHSTKIRGSSTINQIPESRQHLIELYFNIF